MGKFGKYWDSRRTRQLHARDKRKGGPEAYGDLRERVTNSLVKSLELPLKLIIDAEGIIDTGYREIYIINTRRSIRTTLITGNRDWVFR